MKIVVDYDRCEGHGLCEEKAPSVYFLDDAGDLHYAFPDQDVPAEQEAAARAGASVCPVAALRAQ
jgi:ferredoxin